MPLPRKGKETQGTGNAHLEELSDIKEVPLVFTTSESRRFLNDAEGEDNYKVRFYYFLQRSSSLRATWIARNDKPYSMTHFRNLRLAPEKATLPVLRCPRSTFDAVY